MQFVVPSTIFAAFLFSGLGEGEKASFVQAGRLHRCSRDQNLFVYGDAARSFYIICDGTIRLLRETPNGHEITSDILIAGDTVGETEILQGHPTYQFNAFAVKDTTVLEFPAAWLRESAKTNSGLALNLLAILARRTHLASVEAEHKSTMSAAQQVTCFLEHLCILHNFDPAGFELPFSKTLIASRLGMELETFSRALTKIREHGITIKGTHVSFDDLTEVENFVCGNCSIAGNCAEHETLRARLLKKKSTHAA